MQLKEHVEINLTSVISFCRIALAFMKASENDEDVDFNAKSIVLVSSIAGISEAPGLFAYSSSKHGVIGLMRALRRWAPSKYGVRVNAICPWATDTQLLSGVRERWVAEKMPMNSPEDVARIIVQCAGDPHLNGKAVFVSGGRSFDVEEGIDGTRPLWMGEENSRQFDRGQEILGLVSPNPTQYDLMEIEADRACEGRATNGLIGRNSNGRPILQLQLFTPILVESISLTVGYLSPSIGPKSSDQA